MNRRIPTAKVVCASASLHLLACQPELIVGRLICENDAGIPIPDKSEPIEVPWSTSFEDGFCDYTRLAGFCYAVPHASYETVTSPVHSGKYAAAFNVASDDPQGVHTRCVRQGVLPSAAYYGAWYFIPDFASNANVWNLFHFQGGDSSMQHGLWDVSLVNADEDLNLVVFGFLQGFFRQLSTPVPIGTWFHVQLYLERAADESGAIALYLDGEQLFEATDLLTDDSDWGQWYVGNFADALMPASSTVYVDDVSIDATR